MIKTSKHRSITDRPLAFPFIVISTLLVTLLDLFTPMGVSAWIFFVIPLIIAYLGMKENHFYTLVFFIAAIIIFNSFFKIGYIELNVAILNRISGILIFFVLAGLFKRMKKTNKDLHNLNVNLENRVNERTSELEKYSKKLDIANKELAEKVEKLNATNEELETLVYSLSHDLRAHLRHIYGNADILKNTILMMLDNNGRQNLEKIMSNTENLSNILENLLVYAEISRQNIKIENINTQKIFEDTIKHNFNASQTENISWQIQELPNVSADQEMIKSIANCLISNAMKFSGSTDKPVIKIGAYSQPDNYITIYVKDNGIGFNLSDSQEIFNVYNNLQKKEFKKGTGLGLASVKRIVKRLNGNVWAQSLPGEGATFYFSLPKAVDEI